MVQYTQRFCYPVGLWHFIHKTLYRAYTHVTKRRALRHTELLRVLAITEWLNTVQWNRGIYCTKGGSLIWWTHRKPIPQLEEEPADIQSGWNPIQLLCHNERSYMQGMFWIQTEYWKYSACTGQESWYVFLHSECGRIPVARCCSSTHVNGIFRNLL